MTDGSLLITPDGEYLRTMNVKDGYALQLAVKRGYRIIVISGAVSTPVIKRMEYLGIKEIFTGIKDKKEQLLAQLSSEELKKTLFMGDDLPDLALMTEVLVACCPADAAVEIITAAAYISPSGGGKGCVRDVIEKVMKQQGTWRPEGEIAAI
jgi:3-deoxy-D-manno-octulosonate 8-phosphate phosphatase (KDO 8-P phosphatase)